MTTHLLRQLTVVEVVVTYVSLGWAIVMLTNPLALSSSANFARVESVFYAEWVVGIICVILAGIKLVGMAIRSRVTRWLGLMLSGFFWSFISASFLFVGEFGAITTGFVVYSGVAVLCFWTAREVMSHGPAAE